MIRGSYLAVLKDGTHRANSVVLPTADSFHGFVSDELCPVRYQIQKFVYAVGREMQVYNGAEFREVYFATFDSILSCPICGCTESADPLPGTNGRRCVRCCSVATGSQT
jgi:hypothetical protein